MATDATGATTSPDGIPTYNTSVDAPSGLGFNAAMAQIQVALSARVNKPAGIVSGEVPVHNGTTFVRSSVTKIDGANVSKTMVQLYDNILGADTANFDITSIPSTYAHLKLIMYLRDDSAVTAITNVLIRFNNDSAANYDTEVLFGSSNVPSAAESLGSTSSSVGLCVGGGVPANIFASNSLEIPYYANTANQKIIHGLSNGKASTSSAGVTMKTGVSYWRSTAAINQITMFPGSGSNFKVGSRATLYGMA